LKNTNSKDITSYLDAFKIFFEEKKNLLERLLEQKINYFARADLLELVRVKNFFFQIKKHKENIKKALKTCE
jgi:hypothetical protein